jgi:glycerol-3-phosphate dehydrogenase
VSEQHTQVAIVGGGVVGCAVAHALALRGVIATVLEAEPALALGASATNSGILHTGFDSTPGQLETQLILRAAQLREELLEELRVDSWACGARLTPGNDDERQAVAKLAENAKRNRVPVELGDDGSLVVPGETVSDPVAYLHMLAGAAKGGGATIRLDARVCGLSGGGREGIALELADGDRLHTSAAVNCAGLFADEVARMAGEEIVEIYPRKGELIVFAMPSEAPLQEILLPVPSVLGKGVLVFPTLDRRHVIAGPTAREREDKLDWSVESDARDLILERATRMYPPLARAEMVGAYAGLRPAGRGANYVIERSLAIDGLVHVAAIRSTGLSASLAIGEHVAGMLADTGSIELGPVRTLRPPADSAPDGLWWEHAAMHRRP